MRWTPTALCRPPITPVGRNSSSIRAIRAAPNSQPDRPVTRTMPPESVGTSLSIAAASVLAKVHRDRLLVELDREFPGYGLAQHKGYPCPAHLEALHLLGPTPLHRKSFHPVAQALLEFE